MLIGFFIRRIVTVALCAAAFWTGMKTDRLFAGASIGAGDCTTSPKATEP